jgi:hypothetical protein
MKVKNKIFKGRNGLDAPLKTYIIGGVFEEHEEDDFLECCGLPWMTPAVARRLGNALIKAADKVQNRLCDKHPTYKAKRAPTADCEPCRVAWAIAECKREEEMA